MDKRDSKLQETGALRRLENTKSFARGWKPRWSTKIYRVAEVSHGTVIDTEGEEASTKEIITPCPRRHGAPAAIRLHIERQQGARRRNAVVR